MSNKNLTKRETIKRNGNVSNNVGKHSKPMYVTKMLTNTLYVYVDHYLKFSS